MEKKGLNMWNSMGQSGGHSRAQTPWREHLLQRVLISVLCPFVHPWATEEDLEGFYPSHKQFYLPAEVVFRDLQEEEDVACWQWHLSQHRVCEQGQKELRYSSCGCCPKSCPRKSCQGRFKNLSICTHGFSLCVCVFMCVQTTLNDLKVFYNLGTAELSPSSGPSPWNIHTAAKEKSMERAEWGSQACDWKWCFATWT